MIRRMKVTVLGVVGLLASGCGVTATDLPLPGGGLAGESYELTVRFADVLNLPQKAKVTLSGVEIGQVTEIASHGYTAVVSMRILRKFPLPKSTTFELRQATALGEVFIAVSPPKGDSDGPQLAPGDVVPVSQTGSAPTIENMLSALSTLLNGGGLANLKTIVDEINTAFDGRVQPAKRIIRELATTVRVLNERQNEIDRVLVSMDSIAADLVDNDDTVDTLLRDVRPAVEDLAHQRRELITLLRGFDRLSQSSVDLLDANRASFVTLLARLDPVLDGFIAIDQRLDPAMRNFLELYEHLKFATRGHAAATTAEIRGVIVQ